MTPGTGAIPISEARLTMCPCPCRTMCVAGAINQRYLIPLKGNHQQIEISFDTAQHSGLHARRIVVEAGPGHQPTFPSGVRLIYFK